MVQPPRQEVQLYPPISMGQVRGMQRTRRIPIKRRKKSNIRAQGKKEQRLLTPYRTAKQIKKQPSIYQTATDFLSIHQQSLVNNARDKAQVQRLETAEDKRKKDELLELQKDRINIEKQKVSNEKQRDRERARTERVREENRRNEATLQIDNQKLATAETARLNNARLYQEAEDRRRAVLKDQADANLRRLEQEKEVRINSDNLRSQERIAQQSYASATNIARINADAQREFQQTLNNRLDSGERRIGEIEETARRIEADVRQRRTNPVLEDTTIPNLQPSPASSRTITPQPTPQPTPLPSPDPTPPPSPPPRAQVGGFNPGPPTGYFREPDLSFEEQQNIRGSILEGLVNQSLNSEDTIRRPLFDEPQPEPQGLRSPTISEISSSSSSLRSQELSPSEIIQRGQEINREANRDLEEDTTESSQSSEEEVIEEGEPSLTGSAFEVIRPNPIPPVPTAPIPTDSLASPPDEEETTGLGDQIREGIATGGGLVAEGIGTGLRAGLDLGVGVAQGVGGAIAEQLPSANQVGQAIGSGAVKTAQAVGGVVQGALGGGDEEPSESDTGLRRRRPQPEPEPEPLADDPASLREPDVIRREAREELFDGFITDARKRNVRKGAKDFGETKYRLQILEDLDDRWTGRKMSDIPSMKKGMSFALHSTGFERTADNLNQKQFKFYKNPSGKPVGNQFALNLFGREDIFRKAIKDGKIKIVEDFDLD